MRVLGIVPTTGVDVRTEPPIVTDIATAQELLGNFGRISRIDLALTSAQERALRATPRVDALLIPAESERSAFAELTTAFRTNLTALGLLALVVGMFLIYGTMAFAILQRTQTLGILRTLGVSGGEILQTILWESAGIALVATVLGLLLGHVLAIGLVDLVLRTIGDLSFNAAVGNVATTPWIYVQGAVLGCVATLAAAAKPALDAARVAPAAALRRAVLERRAQNAARRSALLALPLLAASGLILAFVPSRLYTAFAGLFGVLAAGALLTPLATIALMSTLDRIVGRRGGYRGEARRPRCQRFLEPDRRGHCRIGRRRRNGDRRRPHDRELPHEPRCLVANDVDGGHLREPSGRRLAACGAGIVGRVDCDRRGRGGRADTLAHDADEPR